MRVQRKTSLTFEGIKGAILKVRKRSQYYFWIEELGVLLHESKNEEIEDYLRYLLGKHFLNMCDKGDSVEKFDDLCPIAFLFFHLNRCRDFLSLNTTSLMDAMESGEGFPEFFLIKKFLV